MSDVWRKPRNAWTPRVESAQIYTKAIELKNEIGVGPWIGKVLSFVESQLLKKHESPNNTGPFVGGKSKTVGAELTAAIREGTGADASGDAKGYRPQPAPASSSVGSRPDESPEKDEAEVLVASGDWKRFSNSRDVYAIRYEIKTNSLFVQYKHWDPSMEIGTQNGPGPVYEYSDVSIPEARSAFRTRNIDEWLTNRVVGRGPASESIKPYRFVSGSKGYTPRKATKKRGREWYEPRLVWNKRGDATTATLPPGPAPEDGKPRSRRSYQKRKKS